ncbi:MAG: putative beta-lysine N-acetyltransferase [Desulfovibrionaceae bacterium]
MQPDVVTQLGNSVIQHGPANDRVYLMKLDPEDMPTIVDGIEELGRENGYSKLFAKVPAAAVPDFSAHGFIDEARVPRMYKGTSDGCFMAKYLDRERAVPENAPLISEVLEVAVQKAENAENALCNADVVRLGPEHAPELAALYAIVFETYPFPITDPDYLREAMNSDVAFFGLKSGDTITAAASAEMDREWKCAEMTDFATLPQERGQGAAGALLTHMEDALRPLGIRTAYTIARAESFGMNVVFSRSGYEYGGTLHNNTQIKGKLESMNVWHKQIDAN